MPIDAFIGLALGTFLLLFFLLKLFKMGGFCWHDWSGPKREYSPSYGVRMFGASLSFCPAIYTFRRCNKCGKKKYTDQKALHGLR